MRFLKEIVTARMILRIFKISIPHWTLFLRENYLGSLTKNLRHWTNCKGQLIRLEGIVRVLAWVLSLYLYFLQIFAPWMVKINNLCCVACIPYSLLKGFWSPMLLKYVVRVIPHADLFTSHDTLISSSLSLNQ